MRLELLVFNNDDNEVFVPFSIDILQIHGFYPDPDDDTVMNLLSYGQLFTVKKTEQLMAQLNYELN